jgi:glycerophosphoryl diester phosphodiesterase
MKQVMFLTKIFGHRGAAGTCPENTMPSFKAAIESGADGIELDVHLSKDGVPVVIHDESVERTTHGKGFVKDLTFSQLKNLDASYLFPEYSGKAFIPSLEEVLAWSSSSDFLLNIELKNDRIPYQELEEKVIQQIFTYKLQNRVILSSFNHESLMLCHRISNELETAALLGGRLFEPWNYAKTLSARAIHPVHYAADPHVIFHSQANGIQVRPFTVNDEQTMQFLFKAECAGFFTDYPERALSLKKK